MEFAGYTTERLLGRGGMGSVYLARHPRLPRLVALKLLNPDMSGHAEVRARFEREAEVVAQLDHPNIVDIYDRGFDNGQLWIAMQYVQGTDAVAVAGPQLPVSRAVHIVSETAKALDYAHAAGVLHRDVKPANILLAEDGTGMEKVVLTDFGIARMPNTSSLTATGSFTATLAYAAPEQLTGEQLDHRTDQYALACSLFVLLTGVGPFDAPEPGRVISGHLSSPVPSISALRRDLPPALDSVLARALAKTPAQRFASCQEFTAAVSAALRPGAAPIPPPATAPPTQRGFQATQYAQPAAAPAAWAPPAPHYPPPPFAPRPRRSGHPWLIAVTAMVLVLALFGAGGVYVAYNVDDWGRSAAEREVYEAFPRLLGAHFWQGTWDGGSCYTSSSSTTPGVRTHVSCHGGKDDGNDYIFYVQLHDNTESALRAVRQHNTDSPESMVIPGSPIPVDVFAGKGSYYVMFSQHPKLRNFVIGVGQQAPMETAEKFITNFVRKAPLVG